MGKVIERPDTTTWMLDFPFHVIKNKEEAENVFRGLKGEDLFVVQKLIGKDSFQPLLAVAIIDNNTNFALWHKYIVPLELGIDIGFKFDIKH